MSDDAMTEQLRQCLELRAEGRRDQGQNRRLEYHYHLSMVAGGTHRNRRRGRRTPLRRLRGSWQLYSLANEFGSPRGTHISSRGLPLDHLDTVQGN